MAKAKDLPVGVPPEGAARTAGEDVKPPPHGTPNRLSAADVAGDLPRVCGQLDRVPPGSKARRFKCRVSNYAQNAQPRYILALDRESAKACHTKAVGLDDLLQGLRDSGAPEKDLLAPVVVVTELPD